MSSWTPRASVTDRSGAEVTMLTPSFSLLAYTSRFLGSTFLMVLVFRLSKISPNCCPPQIAKDGFLAKPIVVVIAQVTPASS